MCELSSILRGGQNGNDSNVIFTSSEMSSERKLRITRRGLMYLKDEVKNRKERIDELEGEASDLKMQNSELENQVTEVSS